MADVPEGSRADVVLQRMNILGFYPWYGEHSRLLDNGNMSVELPLDTWEELFSLAERGALAPEEVT